MRVAHFPSPLHEKPLEFVADAGKTLEELSGVAGAWGAYEARIGGKPVEPVLWPFVRSKGEDVVFYSRPGNLGRILATVAIIGIAVAAGPFGTAVAGTFFTAGSIGFAVTSAVASAVFSAVGAMVVNSLFPPSGSNLDKSKAQPVFSIGQTRNRARPNESIPLLLGRVRQSPDLAAQQTTFFEGREQFLQAAFSFGYGPMAISDLRLGETDLSSFQGVEFAVDGSFDDPRHDLYSRDIAPQFFNIDLIEGEDNVRTTATDARKCFLDFTAPAGIFRLSKKGKLREYPIVLALEYRPTGTADPFTVYDAAYTIPSVERDAIRQTAKVLFPSPGQYDVRVRRITPAEEGPSSSTYQTDLSWSALKTHQRGAPFKLDHAIGAAFVNIKATGQLNGALEDLNGETVILGKRWDGASWSTVDLEIERPADLFRFCLQNPTNPKAVPDEKIDLAAVQDWADYCTAKGWTYGQRRDTPTSWDEVIADVCAAGRAVHVIANGVHSVSFDDDAAPAVHHFTPQNSHDLSVSHIYPDPPHALRVRFNDRTENYSRQERIVYSAGFDETNATLFESVEFPGITDPDHAWRFGRYYLNEMILRPETLTLKCDWESLDLRYADKVAVTHNLIAVGEDSGRVMSVDGSTLHVDTPLNVEAGQDYGITYKIDTGALITRTVTAPAGLQTVFTMQGSATAPAPQTTFAYGVLSTAISEDYRVKNIERDGNFGAIVTLVNHNAAITSDDAATPDAWAPSTTAQVQPSARSLSPTEGGANVVSEIINGETVTSVALGWVEPTGVSVVDYEIVRVDALGAQSLGIVPAGSPRFSVHNVIAGSYTFEITTAIEGATGRSVPLSIPVTVTDDRIRPQIPDAPTGLNATGGVASIEVAWDLPDETDFEYVEVLAGATNDPVAANVIARTASTSYLHDKLGVSDTFFYWVRTVTKADVDNFSQLAGPETATSNGVGSQLLEDGSILLDHLSAPINSKIDDGDAANAAAIIAEADTRAAGDTANAALIGAETTARATAVSALASDVSTLFTETAGNAAAIVTETSARSTAIAAEASARQALAADVSDNTAAILTETNARVSAVSAVSSQVTTLEADLNGDIVSLQQTLSAEASQIDGLRAQYTLRIGAGGHIAGFGLATGAGTAEATFLVDKFNIAQSNGSGVRQVFSVGTVNGSTQVGISGDLIVDGTILSRHIATNSISAGLIQTNAVTGAKISSGAVVNAKLGNGAVNAAKLASSAVTSVKLAGNSVVAGKIAANGVVAGNVAADAITVRELAANSVTAEQANFTTLSALNLTVANAEIQNLAVGTTKIQDNSVSQLDQIGYTGNTSKGNYSTNTWGSLITDTVSAGHAGRIRLDGYVKFSFLGSSNHRWRLRLTVNGVGLAHGLRTGNGGAIYVDWVSSIPVSAGTHIVKLEAQTDTNVRITAGNLLSTQFKK